MARFLRRIREHNKRDKINRNKFPDMIWAFHILSIDPYESSLREINKSVMRLNQAKREKLLSTCWKVFNDERIGFRENDGLRIATIKLLVGAAPYSAHIIEKLLIDKANRNAYEIHFTLFCYLHELKNLPATKRVCSRVLSQIKSYLLQIERDTSRAAWMAGDLLGDHWLLKESLPVLLGVAKEAKYVAGREAAVDGLGKALKRVGASSVYRKQILSLLKHISNSDRSKKVRRAAKYALGKTPLRKHI